MKLTIYLSNKKVLIANIRQVFYYIRMWKNFKLHFFDQIPPTIKQMVMTHQ